jgi:hypothetical protein
MSSNRIEVTSPPTSASIWGANITDLGESQGLCGNATGYAVDAQSNTRISVRNIDPANGLAVDDHNGVGYAMVTAPFVPLPEWTSPGWILLKDTYANASCTTSTSCTATIQAIGSQPGVHVLVAMVDGYGTNFHISAFTATGGTQTLCTASACAGTQASRIVDTAAVIGPTAGTTSVSLTFSAAPQFAPPVDFREYLWTGNNVSYDTGNYASSGGCTTCAAPALTLTGNDLVVVQGFADNNITAVNQCFQYSVSGLATPAPEAGCSNLFTYAAPNFTQSVSGNWSSSAMALKGQ